MRLPSASTWLPSTIVSAEYGAAFIARSSGTRAAISVAILRAVSSWACAGLLNAARHSTAPLTARFFMRGLLLRLIHEADGACQPVLPDNQVGFHLRHRRRRRRQAERRQHRDRHIHADQRSAFHR